MPDGTDPTRRAQRPTTQPSMRRNYLLTILGALLPGAGLLGTRLRRVGVLLLGLTALALILAIIKILREGLVGSALSIGLSRSTLLGLIWVVLIGAVIWCASIMLTASVTRPAGAGRDERLASSLVGFLCCLLVIAPSAYAVRTLGIQRSVVDEVFVSTDDGGKSTGNETGSTPKVGNKDPWAGIPRVNVLLIGSDAGADRVGVRTDSMMVASIDTRTGNVVLIGIPRNLENAPIPKSNPLSTIYPNGYNCGDQCLINGVWTLATDNPSLFPDDRNPGLRTTRDVISDVIGQPIDYSVIVDLSGFSALVNAMGGVEINVKERVCISCHANASGQIVGTSGYIEPGVQHLDGYHALWYARSRAMSDDFSRMRRQRCIVGALVHQVSPAKMLLKYADLAKVLKQDVSIDIPQQHLQAWVPLIEKVQKSGTISSLALTNKVINVGAPDYAKIRELVKTALSSNPTRTTSSTSKPTSSTSSGTTTPKTPSGSPSEETDGLTTLAAAC